MSQNNKTKKILILILLVGLIIRIALACSFPINRFQYDIGIEDTFNCYNEEDYKALMDFDRDYLTEGGHLEYILTIYKTGHLPNDNMNQMYHPPLSQLIFAGFLKIETLFTDNSKFLLESLEFVTIVYSMLIILLGYKIMKEIGFEDKDTILPVALLTFHPLFIYLARLVNTDSLVSLLILVSVLYLMKWYKKPSYKNVIILGLAIGFGAMTKTSIIIMAVPLIFVYMKKIIECVQKDEPVKHIIIQGILFSFITLPMVFWYPIRNYNKFGQALFGIVEAMDSLAIADSSFAGRWVLNHEIFNVALEPHASNVFANLIISTINFAINSYAVPILISFPLRGISLILIAISIVGMLRFTVENEQKNLLWILVVTYCTWIFGYIYFNCLLPYSCTIHARYVITAIVIGIIYIGIFLKNIKSKPGKNFVLVLITIFMIISIVMFVYLIVMNSIIARI